MATLTIFPAIDLKSGQVVRLAEGNMARATVYGDDPAAQARSFAAAGATQCESRPDDEREPANVLMHLQD